MADVSATRKGHLQTYLRRHLRGLRRRREKTRGASYGCAKPPVRIARNGIWTFVENGPSAYFIRLCTLVLDCALTVHAAGSRWL